MPQYLLSVHMVDDVDYSDGGHGYENDEQMQQAFEQVGAFNQKLMDAGQWVFGGGLEPADVATVVDATGTDTTVTDGPFAEAKEHIGGFWVITAPDLDAALALAEEASAACIGPVEVRPFQEEPEG